MKNVFTIGLLALAISTSAEAKNVVKLKNTTKSEKTKRSSAKFFDCQSGITSCGVTYTNCSSTQQNQLDTYDAMENLYCGG